MLVWCAHDQANDVLHAAPEPAPSCSVYGPWARLPLCCSSQAWLGEAEDESDDEDDDDQGDEEDEDEEEEDMCFGDHLDPPMVVPERLAKKDRGLFVCPCLTDCTQRARQGYIRSVQRSNTSETYDFVVVLHPVCVVRTLPRTLHPARPSRIKKKRSLTSLHPSPCPLRHRLCDIGRSSQIFGSVLLVSCMLQFAFFRISCRKFY